METPYYKKIIQHRDRVFRLVQEDGDDLFFESGNAASYTDGINTEAVLGDRVSCEVAVQEIRIDTTKRDSDGFVLESGSW